MGKSVESLFDKIAGLKACKRLQHNNTYFEKPLRAAASEH